MRFGLLHTILLTTIVLSSCDNSRTGDPRVEAIDKLFRSEGVVGTIIVESVNSDAIFIYNDSRSSLRFSPASTFKIPNTLIALDTSAVASKESIFKWDGIDKGLSRWNQDHTLESAFKASCVWCYQAIARTVGESQYELALAALDYGNQVVGDDVDLFWLNGKLQISANEQIEFLRKIVDYTIPFRREYVDTLKEIMLVEQTDDYSIYAKSGWAATEPQVAWYVGWVTTDEDHWIFAMNMRVDRPDQALLRKDLTMRSLRAMKII